MPRNRLGLSIAALLGGLSFVAGFLAWPAVGQAAFLPDSDLRAQVGCGQGASTILVLAFVDQDRDGQQDRRERGIANVEVVLRDADGNEITSAVTRLNPDRTLGVAQFKGLDSSRLYPVTVTPPPGFETISGAQATIRSEHYVMGCAAAVAFRFAPVTAASAPGGGKVTLCQPTDLAKKPYRVITATPKALPDLIAAGAFEVPAGTPPSRCPTLAQQTS